MDNKEEGDKDRKERLEMEKVAPPLPVVGGGRRSRKLRGHPPGGNKTEDGGAYSASGGSKRARRHEGEGNLLKKAGDDGVNVSVQVKVNPRRRTKVTPSSEVANFDESSEAQLKVEGGGEASSSSIIFEGGEEDTQDEDATRRAEMESSEAAPEGGGAHTCLFIENILDVVFNHIMEQPRPWKDVAKDVQSIRLVCKTWKETVTRAYRRTRPVANFKENEPDDCNRRTSLNQFLEVMKSSDMIPVQKFDFGWGAFDHQTLNLFTDFLRICGPEVVSLEIHVDHAEAESFVLGLKDLPELSMPKLRRLEIQTFFDPPSRQGRAIKPPGIVSLIELLLTAATGLEEFELSYPPPKRYGSSHPKPLVTVMQQLGQTMARKLPGTVKALKLRMEITQKTFGVLAEAGMKLRRFEFDGPTTSKMGSKTLHKFLESQVPTLSALRILTPRPKLRRGIENRLNRVVEVPILGELVKLELSDVIFSTATATTRPFDLSKSFPKLHRLELPWMTSGNAFRALLSKPVQSLKVLHLPIWQGASLAPLVKMVAQSCPSLTELHLLLHKGTRETLEEVFRHFDNLQSLHVSISERIRNATWVESVLIGTTEGSCAKIRRSGDFGTVNLHRFQAQPSILNLTRLRNIVVNVRGRQRGRRGSFRRWNIFTDFSAHFIFLGMENLREISLDDRDVAFSPRYRDLLRDKLILRASEPEDDDSSDSGSDW